MLFCGIADKNMLKDKNYYILTLLYTLAWGAMLLNYGGLDSDGWTITAWRDDILKGVFSNQYGIMFIGPITVFLKKIGNGIWIFKFVTFASFIVVGLIFYNLLLRLSFINKVDAFYIAAIAMVFPSNEARVSIAYTFYAYGFASFMIAFFLMQYAFYKKSILFRLMALALFFFSFVTESLLVFYMFPIIYSIYNDRNVWLKKNNITHSLRNLSVWALSKIDFFMLPFLFFAVKTFFYSPQGAENAYHQIFLNQALSSITKTFQAFYTLFDVIALSLSNFSYIAIVLALVVMKICLYADKKVEKNNGLLYLLLLILGSIMFYAGAYPYYVANDPLEIGNPTSRSQLLICLAAGIIIYSVIKLIFVKLFRDVDPIVFIATILALFIAQDIIYMIDYQIDWIKTTKVINIIQNMKPVMSNPGKSFIFIDNAAKYNAEQREVGSGEVTRWLTKAFFGDSTRTGITVKGLQELQDKYNYPALANVVGCITIHKAERDPTMIDKLHFIISPPTSENNYFPLIFITYEPALYIQFFPVDENLVETPKYTDSLSGLLYYKKHTKLFHQLASFEQGDLHINEIFAVDQPMDFNKDHKLSKQVQIV